MTTTDWERLTQQQLTLRQQILDDDQAGPQEVQALAQTACHLPSTSSNSESLLVQQQLRLAAQAAHLERLHTLATEVRHRVRKAQKNYDAGVIDDEGLLVVLHRIEHLADEMLD